MNEDVLDTFSARDSTSQLTTITHRDAFNVNDYVNGAQLQAVLDAATFSDAASDDSAHYITETVRVVDAASSVRTTAQAVVEPFTARDRAVEGRYVYQAETDVFLANDLTVQMTKDAVLESAALSSSVDQTAIIRHAIAETFQVSSRARDAGAGVIGDSFTAADHTTDQITRVERVSDLFSVNDSAADKLIYSDVVAEAFTASDSAAASAQIAVSMSDTFRVYSRASSAISGAPTTSGWMTNALGMAMTRMVGKFPTCRAGGWAGGTTGLHRMGTAPAVVDTGSVRMSKSADRVRVSNVYCDGQLANAFLAVTAENDLRTPQTYTYDYRGRAGISNGRFDTGKGLTCQRMRMVLFADTLQLSRLQVIGGTSNRRL